jgi:hypothetical protein
MQFPYKSFQIDATPRVIQGKYCAQASISQEGVRDVKAGLPHLLPNMRTFDSEIDAIGFALYWAVTWVDVNLL